MHPTTCYQLVNARTAELHQRAARERVATAAARARSAQPQHRTRSVPGHTVTGLARRVLTVAGVGRPAPTR